MGTLLKPEAVRQGRGSITEMRGVRTSDSVENVGAEIEDLTRDILTAQVWEAIADIHKRFGKYIPSPATEPIEVQAIMDYIPERNDIARTGEWQAAAPAHGLTRRHAELCLPATSEAARSVRASQADVWVADLEDSMSPTWENLLRGQSVIAQYARTYQPSDPTPIVRPRGLQFFEPRIQIDNEPVNAAIVDVVIFFHHSARTLVDRGIGPYLYIPKLQTRAQARWWNALLTYLEDSYRIPRGSARAALLIETLPAALQVEEILYELRHHSAGITAGRWDFLFSVLKTYRESEMNLPDCSTITMTTSFMKAFTEELIDVAHRRGTHAIGSLSAYQPSKESRGEAQRVLARVQTEKTLEAQHGFDGSWVASPDVVPTAAKAFSHMLRGADHQLSRPHGPKAGAEERLRRMTNFGSAGQAASFEGLRANVSTTLHYLNGWLLGSGNVEINGMLEDASAAEICRMQVWQWVNTGKVLEEGLTVTESLVHRIIATEVDRFGTAVPSRFADAAKILIDTLREPFEEFLMVRAYMEHLR